MAKKNTRFAIAKFSSGEVHSKELLKSSITANHKYCFFCVFPNGKKIIRFVPSAKEARVKLKVIATEYLNLPKLPTKRPSAPWERAELHAFNQKYSLSSIDEVKTKRKELISELLEGCEYEIVETTITSKGGDQ